MDVKSQTVPEGVPLHLRPRLLPVACKVFWWGQPEDWLDDLLRFVAQVMTYGDWEDYWTTRGALGEEAFRRVLEKAPAGVFDPKSWTFWHVCFGKPVPPLPARQL